MLLELWKNHFHKSLFLNNRPNLTLSVRANLVCYVWNNMDTSPIYHYLSEKMGGVPNFSLIFHGHINDAIGIKRFTLRSKKKVNAQWQLMNMLHNLTKVHRFGSI